jgi:hypothetical protein
MSRPAALSLRRPTVLTTNVWATATATGAALTMALLPFEDQLPRLPLGPYLLTLLEAAWFFTIAVWAVGHVAQRTLPRLHPVLVGAFVVMLGGGIVSALLADGHNGEAMSFLVRGATGWLLFAAIADVAADLSTAARVALAMVLGMVVSAVIGLLIFEFAAVSGPLADLFGRTFTVGGVARLRATFDYPNTAAMAYEVTAFVAIALLGTYLVRNRSTRWLIVAAVVILFATMLLTLSRGAAVGAVAGLLFLTILAYRSQHRKVALTSMAGAILIVVFTAVTQLGNLPLDRLWSESDRGFYGATYAAPAVVERDANGFVAVSVTVTNTGPSTWNASRPDEYQLGFHWLQAGPAGNTRISDGQLWLPPGAVAPGGSATVSIHLPPPPDVAEGDHFLAWDMVHSEVAWFSDRGVPVATTDVPAGTGTAAAPPRSPTMLLYPDLPPEPARAQLWQAAAQMFLERPIFGVGPGTFRLRYGAYIGSELASTKIHSNNTYLELASTTGVLGLAAFLAAVAFVVLRIWRSLRDRREGQGWLVHAAVLAGIVAFLTHGVVDYFLGFNGTAGVFWATLGIGYGLSRE